MLLGDADVEEPVRVQLTEGRQTGRAGHGRGDRDDIAATLGDLDQLIGEGARPAGSGNGGRLPGERVDDAAGVHLFGLIGLGGRIAHAFARDDVHDDRCVEAAGMSQRGFHGVLIVTVDRAHVLQAQVGEHGLRLQRVLESRFDAVHALIADLADERHTAHHVAAPFQEFLVAGLQLQGGQVIGEPADGGRVAPAVVVDDDDHRPPGGGDVVQRFPAHTAGERAVADDGDHMPIAVPGQLEGLGQPVGIGQRGTGVAGLHPVMLALGACRIARQTVLHPQLVEIGGPPGQDLVHVGLVPRVEDDRIMRRIEDPVQRQCQFDDAEIGAQMSAGCSDLVNQEFTDLTGQLVQLRLGQVLQIGGTADLFKHPASLAT